MNKIRNVKNRNFWFNYRTGAVDYTSESRPSSNWRWIQVLEYPYDVQNEIDRLNSEADIIFKLYETKEHIERYVLKDDGIKNRLIGYAAKRNEETKKLDSLYF
jgi:hypothetical protein